MNDRPTDPLVDKVKSLSPELRAEVEQFVDFVQSRKTRRFQEAAKRLGETFRKIDALKLPPMTMEEVQAEVDAVRREQRRRRADRR